MDAVRSAYDVRSFGVVFWWSAVALLQVITEGKSFEVGLSARAWFDTIFCEVLVKETAHKLVKYIEPHVAELFNELGNGFACTSLERSATSSSSCLMTC